MSNLSLWSFIQMFLCICRSLSHGENSNRDLIRCFGLVYELPAPSNASGVLILNRITSIPSYLAINKYDCVGNSGIIGVKAFVKFLFQRSPDAPPFSQDAVAPPNQLLEEGG